MRPNETLPAALVRRITPNVAADVRAGSTSAETGCPRDVRFSPHNDRTADIKSRRRRGHKQHFAPHQMASLFDDLIGNSEHLGRDVEA